MSQKNVGAAFWNGDGVEKNLEECAFWYELAANGGDAQAQFATGWFLNNYWCQRVHGLSQCDTDDAPVFSKVWQQLEEKIADVFFSDQQSIDDIHYQIASIPFVAHNARFDEGCLKAVFKVYQMDYLGSNLKAAP